MNLLDLIAADINRPDALRGVVGTVTEVNGRTVTVAVTGGTVPGVPVARVYASPAVGDVALVVKIGAAWLALTALG